MRVPSWPGLHNIALSPNKERKQSMLGRQVAYPPSSSTFWKVGVTSVPRIGGEGSGHFKDCTEGQKQAC